MLTSDVRNYLSQSVLCWLATASPDGVPNVSPKELFTSFGENQIIIANVASPNSIRNIKQNPKVCVSFIDVLVQKGYKITGTARVVASSDPGYDELRHPLYQMAGERYPFHQIIVIQVEECTPIIAPSYRLFPETTEEQMIEQARKQYGV